MNLLNSGKSGTRIVIVFSMREVARILKHVLEAQGYTCEFTDDVADAKVLVRETRPEVVIMDAEMPDMGGFELFASLTAANPNLFALICDSVERDVSFDVRLGFLKKPATSVAFVAATVELFERRVALMRGAAA